MKRILFILAILIAGQATALSAKTSAVRNLWDAANAAYAQTDYGQAIVYYDSIQTLGYTSYKLYYNLGNAYFKEGNTGRAILNYERALDLRPNDSDTKHNLRIANGFVKDKIESVPEFFLSTWIRSWRMALSSNAWAAISIAIFAVMLSSVLLYLLSGRLLWRKAGFYAGIVSLCLFIITLGFSARERRDILYPKEAIVMQGAAAVKSSPDNNSKELFIIHEGTKVKVMRGIGQWKEIMIADGNKGWVGAQAIEMI